MGHRQRIRVRYSDYMVKRVLVEWDSPARRGDLVELTAVLTISVTPGTHEPTPVPDGVRARLG